MTSRIIVERYWSGDWNAPENRDMTEGIQRASHQLVEWIQKPIFNPNTKTVSFSGKLLGNAVLRSPHISLAREGKANFTLRRYDSPAAWIGHVLPYFEDGRSWVIDETSGSAVATVYDINGQSFRVEFPFPEALGTPSDYVVIIDGFQNGDRVPVINSMCCDTIGYARIRAPQDSNTEG